MVLFWPRGAFSTLLDVVAVKEVTTTGANERVLWSLL
jgi:hypothetical protein